MTQEASNEDLQIEVTEDEIKDAEITPLEYDISVYPADYTLEVLHQKWKNNDIVIPEFQRGYVWTLGQASKLIESFMMGLPIPPVFFYVQPDQKYLVIDGRQRLQTIFYFFEGFFGEPDAQNKRRIFRLEGINEKSKWYKKKFIELDETDQRKLRNFVLRAILVRQLHPTKDDTSIYHIFERLNTGGTSLKDQEVRNCVYAGKFNNLLLELNRYPAWRKILGKVKPDSRQNDVQLILRCLSFLHDSVNYEKPMKDFLSGFMNKNRNPPDEFIENERIRFQKTCDLIVQHLGERPMNPRGALNPSFLDSVFVAFARNLDSCPQDIKERFARLKDDAQYKVLIGGATTDPDVVHLRLELAERILFE